MNLSNKDSEDERFQENSITICLEPVLEKYIKSVLNISWWKLLDFSMWGYIDILNSFNKTKIFIYMKDVALYAVPAFQKFHPWASSKCLLCARKGPGNQK